MAVTAGERPMPTGEGLTFEKVWAMFLETDRIVRETAEQMKETDRKFQETDRKFQETGKRLDDLGKQVGGIHRSIGEIIEILVAAKLWEKFEDWNYGFKRFYQRLNIFEDNTNRLLTDIDLLLLDTDYAMVVEVKREADSVEVERHIKRMGLVKQYPPEMAKGKILIGAIASGIITSDAINQAHEHGFFVLRLRGESVELVSKKGEFEPREWGRAD